MNLIEQLEKFIVDRLKGIDKDEIEDDEGWWPNSVGAKFGASVLEDLRAIIEQHKSEAVEPVAVLALKNTELSNRVDVLEDLLSSAYAIANRNGENTHWGRFAGRLHVNGINPVTAKTFKILTSDPEYTTQQPDRTKLIGELVRALDRYSGCTGRLSDEINALLTKARESIK